MYISACTQDINEIPAAIYIYVFGATNKMRRLRHICRSAGKEVTKHLIAALVLNRLDYCNVVLEGLPESTVTACTELWLPSEQRIILTSPMLDGNRTSARDQNPHRPKTPG